MTEKRGILKYLILSTKASLPIQLSEKHTVGDVFTDMLNLKNRGLPQEETPRLAM